MSEAQQPTIDTLWDFNDPAASEDRFRAAAESATGAQLAEIQTKIARAMGLQERFDDGHATLDAIAETGSRRVQVLIAWSVDGSSIRRVIASTPPATFTPRLTWPGTPGSQPWKSMRSIC